MGILEPDGFADGQIRLDPKASLRAFESLECRMSTEERVRFAWSIALNNIGEEVGKCVLRHGVDSRDFSLVAFGSAGPMLLAGALDLVRARRLIVPPHPGLFSALGLLSTDFVYADSRSSYLMLGPDSAEHIETIFADLEARLRAQLRFDSEGIVVKRSFDGRLAGQSWETPFIAVPPGSIATNGVGPLVEEYHAEYQRRNGIAFRGLPVQGVTWRVQIIAPSAKLEWKPRDLASSTATAIGKRELRYLAQEPISAPVYRRTQLAAGTRIRGAALIVEPLATTLVMPEQTAEIGLLGEIVITGTS